MEAHAVSNTNLEPTPLAWHDSKRYYWLLGLIIPTLPFQAWAAVELTGSGLFWWLGPVVFFVFLPILDVIFGKDSDNPPDSVLAALENDRYYRRVIFAYVPLQYAALVMACWQWAYGDLTLIQDLGLAVTIGCVSGLAINTAHELGHKREHFERWLSKVALAQTFYGHFFIEHNRGHHVRVSTPEDPASSRMGESFWAFLPRTIAGSLASAWGIEKQRMQRLNKPVLSIHNDVINAWAMSIVLFGVLVAIFGVTILPWLAIQAVFGFALLEVVNYLEHYGLARQRGEDGRYERCRPEHSWNSNNVASNVFLYHLQRHSDHHAHPTRRYQTLRHFDAAPELPSGYSSMILLAYATPLWRRVMDPKLAAHYGGDLSKANIQPRARKRIERRYGALAA